jgi:acyl dehydratase
MAHQDKAHIWDMVEIGDAAPPYVFEVTAEKIADYCRTARYENLVYTNQPAARETGLPGIIAPPAMALVYAPVRLKELLEARGLLPSPGRAAQMGIPSANVALQFYGVLVEPGDVITSVTSVQDKSQGQKDKSVTLQVIARNQRNELVAQCQYTYCWKEV